MPNMKSSKDKLNQATNNLDPNIAKIEEQTKSMASTLSQNSSAIKKLSESISAKEASDGDFNENIRSSLDASNKTIGGINNSIKKMTTTVSSLNSVISNISENTNTTVSLLGSIQTSLIQITSVLSAFRSDFLLANSGNSLNGEGYYDVNLLMNNINSLQGIKNANLQSQLALMKKAANYANKSSNVVRSRLGNSNMAKDDDEMNIIDKLLGKVDQAKKFAVLTQLLKNPNSKIAKAGGKLMYADTSSIGGLLGSFMGDKGKAQVLNPLKNLGRDLQDADDPLSRALGGLMGKMGLSKDKKEREKDPNLVMSSLAPFADDIKDMVETAVKGLHERPTIIPSYATPVWVVNSKDQTDYIKNSGRDKDKKGKELKEKRIMEILEGVANNPKDKYGNDLLKENRSSNGTKYYTGELAKNENGGYDNDSQKSLRKVSRKASRHQNAINHETEVYLDDENNIHNERSEFSKKARQISESRKNSGIFGGVIGGISEGGLAGAIPGGLNVLISGNKSIKGNGLLGEYKDLFKAAREGVKESHANGRKGKKTSISLDPNRNETTESHDTPIIDDSTTVVSKSNTKKFKSSKDILTGQLGITAGITALLDLTSQETIFLSQAANDGKINPKTVKEYQSSFDILESFANSIKADDKSQKAIKDFKKNSNLSKIIPPPKSKRMTTSEYFGIEEEGNGENKGGFLDALKQGGIKGLAMSIGGKLLDKAKNSKIGKAVTGTVNKVKDKVKNKITEKIDSAKDKIKDKVKDKLKNSKMLDKAKNSLKGVGKKISNTNTFKKIANSKIGQKVSSGVQSVKKEFAEQLKSKTEETAAEEAAAKEKAKQEEANAKADAEAEQKHKKEINDQEMAASKERSKAKESSDKALAVQEKAAQAEELAADKAANATIIANETATATVTNAVEDAAATGEASMDIKSAIKGAAAKLAGNPILKAALAAAGIAMVAKLGAKLIKTVKKAKKGKGGNNSVNDEGGSSGGGSDSESKKAQKEAEKEQKKQERKEKREKRKKKVKRFFRSKLNRLTFGLTAAKVYVDSNGDVLKSKGDEPVKKLDDNGDETDETLNIKDTEGKKQFIKRLFKREFKLDKGKLAGKTLKKGKGIKKIGKKIKGIFKKGKEKVNKSGTLGAIAGGLLGGPLGVIIGGAISSLINKSKDKKASNKRAKDKRREIMNQLLLISTSPFLFMDNKLQKSLNNIENSDMGKTIISNPTKAANTLFNLTAGNLISKIINKKEDNNQSILSKVMDKLTKKLFKDDEKLDKEYSSDLSDGSFGESATYALAKMNQNNNNNELLNAFSSSLGLGAAAVSDNGNIMTTSKLVNQKRKENAIKLGVVGEGATGINGASGSSSGGTNVVQTIPSVIKAFESAGIVGNPGDYNQSGKTINLNVNGKSITTRPDCTGFIDAVIESMGYNSEGMNSSAFNTCKGIKDSSGNISSDWRIIDNPELSDIQAGDICIIYSGGAHHGEIASGTKNNKIYGWSYGSESGMKKALEAANLQLSGTDPLEATIQANSTINSHKKYTRIIRYVGAVSTGGSTATVATGKTAQNYLLETISGSRISRGVSSGHNGIDFATGEGNNPAIYSPFGGKVVQSAHDPNRKICTNNNGANKDNGGMGNFVIIQTNDGNYATFMHMYNAPLVKTGDTVTVGQQIGKVGNTGDSYGNHLHFEIRSEQRSGSVIDPANYSLTGKGKSKKRDKNGNLILDSGNFGGSKNHLYQRDYSIIPYNTSKDNEYQTLGDSGCGPAAAAVVQNVYGRGKKRVFRYGGDKEENLNNDSLTTTNASTTQKTATVGESVTVVDDKFNHTYELTLAQYHIDTFNALKAAGLTDEAACGALGNFLSELGNVDWVKQCAKGNTGYGGGMMAWSPYSIHLNWCNNNGYSGKDTTLEANIAHAVYTLQHEGKWGNPKKASPSLESQGYNPVSSYEEFASLKSVEDAAVNYERIYEISYNWNGITSEKNAHKLADWEMYDRPRVYQAICFYNLLCGTYKGGVSGSTANASNGTFSGGITGFLNLITDSAVDGSSMSEFISGNNIWNNDSSNVTDGTSTNGTSPTTGSGRYGKGYSNRRGKGRTRNHIFGKANDAIGFKNTHFVSSGSNNVNNTSSTSVSTNSSKTSSTSASTNSSKTSSTSASASSKTSSTSSSYIKNNMTVKNVNNNGNSTSTTNVYTSNNKTTLTTNGNSTIVICNNFAEKSNTNLNEILSNFKHLNGTQNNALKVLKAISELIKEDDTTASDIKLRLDSSGLDYILKGL